MKKIGKIMSVLVAVAMLAAVATISVSATIPGGAANSWTDPTGTIRLEFVNPGNNAFMDLVLVGARPAGDLEITFNEIGAVTDGTDSRFVEAGGASGSRFEGAVTHNGTAFFSAFVSMQEMRANERVARFDFDEDETGIIGWVSLNGTVNVGGTAIVLDNVLLTNAVLAPPTPPTTTIATPPTTIATTVGTPGTTVTSDTSDLGSSDTSATASATPPSATVAATTTTPGPDDVVKGGIALAIVPTLVAAAAAIVVAKKRK
jgi:hypothetical protein